ncbi:hypothetical protein GWI33_005761 [Rhynchophorus ferrugineus]|uniref:Mucolipin-3-like protein n=1 Tax=Rhynchophorus ferrugineus TaxID=354439 RepID=A0A834MHS7_RHYFE|nr:hypothetical protein GWI33_005761 [Rhynchophorus ferrugineus]
MDEALPQVDKGVETMGDSDDEQCGIQHPRCYHNTVTPLLTEERMRRKLQFFFMNPIEKWQAKSRFPYKFVVQVIKIILVTMQLCLFAYSRYNHINYTWDNKIAFSHLFLKDWDATREANSYPPSIGPLAVYKEGDFYDTINYAYEGYTKVEQAVGSYSYANEDDSPRDMILCLYQYKEAFVRAELTFSLKTVNFKAASRISAPNCYKFDITIYFDNEDQDGQILVGLDAEPVRLTCKGDTTYIKHDDISLILRSLLNYTVIITCIISLILCTRAVWRAQQLKRITIIFFEQHFEKTLNANDRSKFLNLWYIMIIVNDLLIIMGSSIKEQIEREEFTNDEWNICSLFLGVGNMLVWFGVLRYVGFFKTYNVVILTLQKAAPQVVRFLFCTLLIYAGFTFCGWLILGPYHLKFRSISTTSECLFSLINGDDMFATFSIMSTKSKLLWWFSRIYLYSFISLYIYVILSLFIAVIMDAYETIKLYYKEGFPKSDLEVFIGETNGEEVSSGIFRSSSCESLGGLIKDLCCCCPRIHKSYKTLTQRNTSTKYQCRKDIKEDHVTTAPSINTLTFVVLVDQVWHSVLILFVKFSVKI